MIGRLQGPRWCAFDGEPFARHRMVELEPMGPFERRTVHMYLRDRTDVQTHSEGDEPERRLVVTPVRFD